MEINYWETNKKGKRRKLLLERYTKKYYKESYAVIDFEIEIPNEISSEELLFELNQNLNRIR